MAVSMKGKVAVCGQEVAVGIGWGWQVGTWRVWRGWLGPDLACQSKSTDLVLLEDFKRASNLHTCLKDKKQKHPSPCIRIGLKSGKKDIWPYI